jgi:hypothetical protein
MNNMALIRRFCQHKARPPVISSLFRDVPRKQIRLIYRDVTGEGPPRGQLSISIDTYFSCKFHIQASVIGKVYVDSVSNGLSEAEALLHAYETLLQLYKNRPSNLLDICQAWHLTRYIERGDFKIVKCGNGHSHLQDTSTFVTNCPVCKEPSRARIRTKKSQNRQYSIPSVDEKGAKMVA